LRIPIITSVMGLPVEDKLADERDLPVWWRDGVGLLRMETAF